MSLIEKIKEFLKLVKAAEKVAADEPSAKVWFFMQTLEDAMNQTGLSCAVRLEVAGARLFVDMQKARAKELEELLKHLEA